MPPPIGERATRWRCLQADGLWLAVLHGEQAADGLEFRLLTVLRDGASFVLGASTEESLHALLGGRRGAARLVHAPGHHLTRIWPDGHHLVLDAGTPHAVVFSAAEMCPNGTSFGGGGPRR